MMIVGRDSISANDNEYAGEMAGKKPPYAVCIGGDSSPASAHESPLKCTCPESVSTDLPALSRGFIPGGIVVMWGKKPALRGVCIGGDSSPASAHGSLLKRTRPESVSTDLPALSRGFIPGGIVVM